MKKLGALFILLFVFAAGCANNNQGGENLTGDNDIRDNTSYMSNTLNRQMDNTRGWQMSDQNPNLPNTDGGRVDQHAVIEKATKVVNDTGNYRADSVWINGDDLWVTAYKKGRLTDRDRNEAAAELRKKLIQAFPRYHVRVKIQEDRT